MPRQLRAAVLLLPLFATVACGGGGGSASGAPKRTVLNTEYDDARVGQDAITAIEAEMGMVRDRRLNEMVEEIGRRLARGAPRRSFGYSFKVVDQDAPNAFALPGGYIFVSRGLLALSNTEGELAGVIGHEITHSAARHAASAQARQRSMNPLSLGYVKAGQLAAYGRDQERDADRGGQFLAASAGYDPAELASFLRALGNMERLSLGWSRLPGFFDSHPATLERVSTNVQRAKTFNWTPKPQVTRDQTDYLSRLQTLVVGPDPKQGIFVDTRFIHRDLDFTMRFPEGWYMLNTQQAVGAISRRRDAQIFLEVLGRSEDLEGDVEKHLAESADQSRSKVTRKQRIKLGDLDAVRIEGESSTRQGKMVGSMTWFIYNGLLYRVTGASLARIGEEIAGRARSTARSFRPLDDNERKGVTISTLQLVRARGGESLSELTERSGNAWEVGRTAVMNHMFIDERLEEGRLIKVALAREYIPTKSDGLAAR